MHKTQSVSLGFHTVEAVPRRRDSILINGLLYTVYNVIFNIDKNKIIVLVEEM